MDNFKTFLSARRTTTILAIALFFAFSWLSYGAYIRFDLSSAGAMRISGTTKNLLRNLPEKATIELFVSNDLPDEAILVARKARDFIQEYVNSGKGRVKLTILRELNQASLTEINGIYADLNKHLSNLHVMPEGGPLRRQNFRKRGWVPAGRAVGIEGLRFHDLRGRCNPLPAHVFQPQRGELLSSPVLEILHRKQ